MIHATLAALVLAAQLSAQTFPFVFRPLAGSLETGDGGAAVKALLKTPYAVAAEAGGGFLVLDSDHYQVRRVAADGTIAVAANLNFFCNDMKVARDGTLYLTTPGLVFKIPRVGPAVVVAGGGRGTGENVPAGSLVLDAATNGVAPDSSGGVYFVEGQRVRYVGPDGIVRTVAGTGTAGYNGDNRPAAGAQLNSPWGLALDGAGNLYIADRLNSRIRKVTPAGIITTVAGTGTYGAPVNGSPASPLGFPEGVAVDGSGNLFITDIGTNMVLRVDGATGLLTRLNGGTSFNFADGPAASTWVHNPAGIAVDGDGNVLFTELTSHRVRMIRGGNIRTVAGRLRFDGDGGPAADAVLSAPQGVALDGDGSVLIADWDGYRIRRVTRDGVMAAVTGTGIPGTPVNGTPAEASAIPAPTAIAADGRGNLYFSSSSRVFRIAGGVITAFAGTGASGDSGDGGAALDATFRYISGLATDAAGNLYIGDHTANRVRRVDGDGRISAFAGTGGAGYAGDNGPARAAQLRGQFAMPLAFDRDGNLYIGDSGNFRVRMVSAAGVMTTVAGNGTSGTTLDGSPAAGVALDYFGGLAADGSGVYIATRDDRAIYRAAGGIVRRISGGSAGAPASGVSAVRSRGFETRGIVLDENGDLIAADRGLGVVWKMVVNSPSDLLVTSSDDASGGGGSSLRRRVQVKLNGRAGVGVEGVAVNFAVESGGATLSDGQVLTDATGAASTVVTLAGPGTVTVSASAAGLAPARVSVTGGAPALTVSTEALAFRWAAGGEAPGAQAITVGEEGVRFTVAAAVESDVVWLVAEAAGTTVNVGVTRLEELAPGSYRGTVTIRGTDTEPAVRVVSVELTVEP